MNKQALIGIIAIVVILLIGGGAYALMHTSSSMSQQKSVTATKEVPTETSMKTTQGTLKDLLASGTSEKCTYSDTSSSVNGAVYVANGKMRGDFTTTATANEKAIDSHMIVDNGYSYIWTSASNQGYKMSLAQMEPSVSPAETGANSGMSDQTPNLNKSMSYSCGGWTEDDTVFTPPSTITFTSMNMAMPSMNVPTGSAGASSANPPMCSACNNIPAGPSRDACKTQLHCQ